MGPNDFGDISHPDHVKIVGAVNNATIFPACKAVVHHGGAGTTAAALRAGVPELILWNGLDQPFWSTAIDYLGVGGGQKFSATTPDTLAAGVHVLLTPEYVARAREVATRMTKPAESLSQAADLLEEAARQGREG
jgi:UDP:flavonoid glycosyltransferase YjiC (YdhE family)